MLVFPHPFSRREKDFSPFSLEDGLVMGVCDM
jgi:hypothetical protein